MNRRNKMALDKEKKEVLKWLEENASRFTDMSDQIWENPEVLWEEFFASRMQADFLEKEGFSITWDVAEMNTAFIAEWGEGKPILAMIGEYDALPGLSQKKQATKEAVVEGGPGHGCGHNMLGTASVAAAVAVQKWVQNSGTSGTIRYYGCPAEEGGGGKVFMARAGLFDDLDSALTYHPGDRNFPWKGGTVAIQSSRFRFNGVAAHAGMAPHLGRSALDAVELMNVGANYLREHVLDGTRIQYIITDGGQAANIVPETAEVEYIIRAEKTDYLEEVVDRLRNIAKGAALMTDTEFQEEALIAYSSLMSNHTLADLTYAALEFIGPIEYTEAEIAFAQKINDAFPGTNEDYAQRAVDYFKPSAEIEEMFLENKDMPLLGANFPAMDAHLIHKGATDLGDLSQITPTVSLFTACFPTGSPGHSWANVACGGMSIGHKGMMHGAKALALTALDLYSDPKHIQAAQDEFDRRMGKNKYVCPIPDNIKPPRFEPKP
jgi:aminobenzoyl-glutamate utilization protein B